MPTGLLPVWRMTFGSATNRTSVGMVAELFSQVCAGEGATTRDKGYRYRSTHAGNFNQDFRVVPTGLLPVWLGLRSKGKNEFTSALPSLPARLGPTHDTGRHRQPEFLAVVTLRVNRGHQYRRLLLTDRSKPVSARRGLPTLTLLARPETAFDDKRGKELAESGLLVIA